MGRPFGSKNKQPDLDAEGWERIRPAWRGSRTVSSEIVKLDNLVKGIQTNSSRRTMTAASLKEALTRIECAVYAIRQDLKK